MNAKRQNWMLTIWTLDFPRFIQELDELKIAHTQKEVTGEGIIHWQTFCQFNKQVTRAALKAFFDKHKTKCHIGQKKGAPPIKTVLQGLQYVSGYGPLALSKLRNHTDRYIVKPNEIIHTPVDDDHLEIWTRLSEESLLTYQLRRNAIDQEIIWKWQMNKHRIKRKTF